MAALTAVILAAVAVLLAALRYATTQRNLVALGKVFGAQNRQILTALALLLLWLVLAAALVGGALGFAAQHAIRSEEHTSELQSRGHLVCSLLLEMKNS